MEKAPRSALKPLPLGSVTPEGWLKRQMLLADDLQKRLGASPAMLQNGRWTNGETLPRYVRGLILLSASLGDERLREKADSFLSAIFDSAETGGDFGAASGGGLAAKIEAVKAVLSYYELTGEERALSFLRRFFKNQFNTLDVTPLWADARARLPEEVPAIAAVYRESEAGWLKDLAVKLCSLSCNWVGIANKFPYKKPAERSVSARALKKAVRTVRAAEGEKAGRRAKLFTKAYAETEWKRPAHRIMVETNGINLAKAVKYPCVCGEFAGDPEMSSLSLRMVASLMRYHGNATGMFAADGRLAGTSAVRGIDVESAAEMMESLVVTLAAMWESACADLLEEIAFNVMGAAGSDDLSSVRDVMMPNQTDAEAKVRDATGFYPRGGAFSRGVPSRGAVALLSAFPTFLRSVCMTREGELDFFSYAPCTIRAEVNGAKLTIREDTGYPFRNTVVFKVEEADGDVSLRINFRVPSRTTMQLISGGQVVATGERSISVKCILRTGSTFMLRLNIPLTAASNRDGSVSLYKGSLLMAATIGEERGAERALPDAECVHATGKWAFAPVLAKKTSGGRTPLLENERTVVGAFTERPFDHKTPPFELKIKCRNVVNWEYDEDGLPSLPRKPKFSEEATERTFLPFGCTSVRISQFPVCHRG